MMLWVESDTEAGEGAVKKSKPKELCTIAMTKCIMILVQDYNIEDDRMRCHGKMVARVFFLNCSLLLRVTR